MFGVTEPALKCKECGEIKPCYGFYKTKTGWNGKCKECVKKRVRENRKEKLEYYKNYEQKRNQKRKDYIKKKNKSYQEKNPEKVLKAKKKWAEENKLQRSVHVIFGNAVKNGRIKKGLCQICKTSEVEAHHYDYTKPLNVVWLCKEHHEKIHWWLRWNRRKYENREV